MEISVDSVTIYLIITILVLFWIEIDKMDNWQRFIDSSIVSIINCTEISRIIPDENTDNSLIDTLIFSFGFHFKRSINECESRGLLHGQWIKKKNCQNLQTSSDYIVSQYSDTLNARPNNTRLHCVYSTCKRHQCHFDCTVLHRSIINSHPLIHTNDDNVLWHLFRCIHIDTHTHVYMSYIQTNDVRHAYFTLTK